MELSTQRQRVIAVLGPTNTGKTHLAMERLLAHPSGIIGFPLRLLARENYDRAVKARGRNQVALITGEEKILPEGARYFLCTVEAMPLDRPADFLAIDEIQMCADPDRGHVFTERLLKARGRYETMLLGAETIRPLIQRLAPEAEFMTRPRLSVLRYTGPKKVTRLPPRSAVVAFSAAQVYALAELVRRQRGGAAVVLGALSPRTRNAQVAMYQAGEVDYLVATDAIGMGLNMDIDHVAFAGISKFDGRHRRNLAPAELAQIAGRAGRAMNDGTFGTTADQKALDPDLVEAIESHRFDPLTRIFWRNGELEFSSLHALRHTLARPAPRGGLMRARAAEDEQALALLLRDETVTERAATPEAVRLLWEVCQVPDFQGVMTDAHAGLLATVYKYLTGKDGRLPEDWMAGQVKRLDRTDGDIDALTQRIAHIRTWTYVSFHGAWLNDAPHWQGRTRAIEDKLSDALHERLTQRFVDKSTAHLMKRLKDTPDLMAAVTHAGDVVVEGHAVGHLKGFLFDAAAMGGDAAGKAIAAAAGRALKGEFRRRVQALEKAPDEAIRLAPLDGDRAGVILWDGVPVGRLAKGDAMLRPAVRVLASDLLDAQGRDRVTKRLETWLAAYLGDLFRDLLALDRASVTGPAKGLAFRLGEAFGSLPRAAVDEQLALIGKDARRDLRAAGVRIGRETVFLPALVRPAPAAMRGFLWCLAEGRKPVPPPPPGRVSMPAGQLPADYWEQVGFRRFGRIALRVDMVERVAAAAWELANAGGKAGFEVTPDLLSLAGCGAADMARILRAIGFKGTQADGVLRFRPAARKGPPAAGRKGKASGKAAAKPRPPAPVDPHSPFAKLKDLALS
ncbi:MAG: disulfide oxidoreductase [Rhodospirillales bacterium CG15_BIG_FIL_POST_REV_8_21_14_020_66_15]|nr:MAG: disulfide oxidoreductase [Rhodospirillales bacterium CG15_BIG_FIL_POST_REV_8_21_14_020_66_15]